MAYSSPFQAAFESKIRITEKKERNGDKGATHFLCVDITPEEAVKFANYLMERVKAAQSSGETIRTYTSQSEYSEKAGFTVWGNLWNNDGRYSGSLSPKALEQEEAL
jgi:hypothetical protein